ncbi:hypothetical protein [Ancylobacter pratisalsi]|uniref:Uncharacterized protein n=1 Tax=Ancylobacter pratisalsi TaxID=1745854 RepID=A0A6P1YQX0_9HYPH|nr:hypothetical protein [Ancylobacter pratisalsi]QIB35435.1 hypothetical protein G3A50_18255 [Ancylobacter pratisalsi]
MNHARRHAARPLLKQLLVVTLLACAGASPLRAQAGITDLPTAEIDPRIDPFPYDARKSLRDYLRVVLPTRWWANEPQFSLGVLSAQVHVPDGWKGNPTSAMMNLCPPYENAIWRHVSRIDLVPFYQKVLRPGVRCER